MLVVRAFENPSVPLPRSAGGVDPLRDVDTMLELTFSALGIIERRWSASRARYKMKGPEREFAGGEQKSDPHRPILEQGTPSATSA